MQGVWTLDLLRTVVVRDAVGEIRCQTRCGASAAIQPTALRSRLKCLRTTGRTSEPRIHEANGRVKPGTAAQQSRRQAALMVVCSRRLRSRSVFCPSADQIAAVSW
jgi:hypothetical protein